METKSTVVFELQDLPNNYNKINTVESKLNDRHGEEKSLRVYGERLRGSLMLPDTCLT